MTRPDLLRAKSLRLRLTALEAELAACRTWAESHCVRETIVAVERQLTELAGVGQ